MQIILNYLWLLPLAIAAICNAVCDTLKDHYPVSIFTTWKNQDFVDPTKSWDNKYTTWIPDTFTDLWHTCKFAWIFFFMVSLMLTGLFWRPQSVLDILLFPPIFGLAWNLPFNLFYNKILKR